MRAAQTQAVLVRIDRMPDAERTKILTRFGTAGREEVDAALPVAWLPMGLHMKLSDALRDVVGSEGTARVFQQAMTSVFERPILRSFISLTTGIFGVTPHGLLKRSDRIYEQITRNLGELSYVQRGLTEGEIHLVGFPGKDFTFECYVDGMRGCLLAALDLCKIRGEVLVLSKSGASGSVTYQLIWK